MMFYSKILPINARYMDRFFDTDSTKINSEQKINFGESHIR